VERVRSELDKAVGAGLKYPPSRATGELKDSLGATPVRGNRMGGYDSKIGFNEPRRKQYAPKTGRKTRSRTGKRSYNEITNALIAHVLHYGKRSANQPAKPFMRKAKIGAEKPIFNAMAAVWERRKK
jgi:hypothetical protein